jgi:hypothetical protein
MSTAPCVYTSLQFFTPVINNASCQSIKIISIKLDILNKIYYLIKKVHGKNWGMAMIRRLVYRAWILALVGASICAFSPHFLHADPNQRVEGQEQQSGEGRTQNGNAAEQNRGERRHRVRNMHPVPIPLNPIGHSDLSDRPFRFKRSVIPI